MRTMQPSASTRTSTYVEHSDRAGVRIAGIPSASVIRMLSAMETTIHRPAAQSAPRSRLLAYIHLRIGVPDATRALLVDYITRYADMNGFELRRIYVGVEGSTELLTLRHLVAETQRRAADTVLVTGSSRTALLALHRISGLHVLTMADVCRTSR